MHPKRTAKSDRKESGLVQRVRFSLRTHTSGKPHVLLACSAGKDSVALACVLSDMARQGQITLSLAHIHHGQHHRADEAAEAVRKIGTELGVGTHIRYVDLDRISDHQGVGLEEALRRERYLSLAEVATEVGASVVALAHHQQDQAETLLLHLLRGSGVDGMSGMRAWQKRTVPWWADNPVPMEINIWRPLLQESVESLVDLATTSGLPVVEDPTNADVDFRRNAVRHHLLPQIEIIAPGATAAIARSANAFALDADLLSQLIDTILGDYVDNGKLSCDHLISLPDGMQARVVRAWISAQAPQLEIGLERVLAVLALAQRNRGGATLELGDGVRVVTIEGKLCLIS